MFSKSNLLLSLLGTKLECLVLLNTDLSLTIWLISVYLLIQMHFIV